MSDAYTRPDKKSAKIALKTAKQLNRTLSDISAGGEHLKKSAQQHAVALRHTFTLQEMAGLDLETLNAGKQGIRISALKNAGIKNMSQLYGLPVGRITAINGIGEQTAIKIKRSVDDLYEAVSASARVHIDLKKRNLHQDELLKALYSLQLTGPARIGAENLLSGAPYLSEALHAAKPAASGLRWFFASKKKKEKAIEAYSHIEALLSGSFVTDAARIASEYGDAQKASKRTGTKAVLEDYEKKSVEYYIQMEALGLSAPKSAAVGLPEELVAEIEGYPLDLTHMKATLRSYQVFGAKYVLNQKKTLLGDEMGLGKTIQALSVIADSKAKGETHFLVVCPASVLVNWKREAEKFTDIPAIIIHGFDKMDEFEQWRNEGGIAVTNFETIIKLADYMDFEFGVLVVDEAHFVKNPEARRTKALLAATQKTQRILYMTGTPLENRVDEMCFLVGCLRADIARNLMQMKTLSATQKFKNELVPVYLRRVRDDVLTELPDLIESEDWLEPTKEELKIYYEAVFENNFMAMRRISWNMDPEHSSKAERLLELCEDAREDGRKIIVFSFFIDTLQKVCALLRQRAIGPITGAISTDMRQQLIDEFSQGEEGKVLVAQVQAGGVGLNIQSASVVIFCEPQIKPSLETQAISRAYRMGQVRDVLVHRLLCENTVDERMMEILRVKQGEFDKYAEESVVGSESLKERSDSAWIKDIVAQEKARAEGEILDAGFTPIDNAESNVIV